MPTKASLIAFAAYVVACLLLGEHPPLSRYDMYAAAGDRTFGAVPVYRADGEFVDVEDYERFHGIDPARVYPERIPTSLRYRAVDGRRWIAAHQSSESGPVHFDVGFLFVRVDGKQIHRELQVVQQGTAWRR